MDYPDCIVVTFTEEDRQTASRYTSNGDCLLATALKRMGFTEVSVRGSGRCSFNAGESRRIHVAVGCWGSKEVEPDERPENPPFYKPEVAGMTLTLIPSQENDW